MYDYGSFDDDEDQIVYDMNDFDDSPGVARHYVLIEGPTGDPDDIIAYPVDRDISLLATEELCPDEP